MNAIQNFFVRAKHWQVFLLLFGLFFLGNAVGLQSMIQNPDKVFEAIWPVFGLTELLAVCLALWLWSLGAFLNSVVVLPHRPRLSFFRLAIIYPLLYMPVFMAYFQSLSFKPPLLPAIVPLHFFAMFCLLYDLYFVAKNLALVEKQRSVSLGDYLGYFCGLWIFPIGIWIVQPRINRLYAASVSRQTA